VTVQTDTVTSPGRMEAQQIFDLHSRPNQDLPGSLVGVSPRQVHRFIVEGAVVALEASKAVMLFCAPSRGPALAGDRGTCSPFLAADHVGGGELRTAVSQPTLAGLALSSAILRCFSSRFPTPFHIFSTWDLVCDSTFPSLRRLRIACLFAGRPCLLHFPRCKVRALDSISVDPHAYLWVTVQRPCEGERSMRSCAEAESLSGRSREDR
jgi:hypothetical protein